MNPLINIIEQKKTALSSGTPISRDSFDLWLNNECTKRFMAEIEINILDEYGAAYSDGYSARDAVISCLTDLIDWKPSELDIDE